MIFWNELRLNGRLSYAASFCRVDYTQIYVSADNPRKIVHVYVHPDYNPITYDHNIAIMEVDPYIPVDDHWTRPVFLPKTPLTAPGGKLKIAFPFDTILKPYMATIMPDDECARINGNANVSTNTLMCIDGLLCSQHECNGYVSSADICAQFHFRWLLDRSKWVTNSVTH